MIRIILKGLLFLAGASIANTTFTTTTFVIAVLVSLTVVALNHYLNKRSFCLLSSMGFYGLCVLFPAFVGFIPVVSFMLMESLYQHRAESIRYDIYESTESLIRQANQPVSLSSKLMNRYGYVLASLFPMILHLRALPHHGFIQLLLLLQVATIFHFLIVRNEVLMKQYITVRDSNMEYQLKLLEQNQSLIQNQEADIHLATLKERNRIAREIHDNVGHLLTRAILQIGLVQTLNQNDSLRPSIDGLKETLDSAMDNIRESVHDLRDDSISLREAIHKLTETLPCTIHLSYSIESDVPSKVKYCFLGILKESITNISKHSNATAVDISIKEHPALFQLLIHDNGTIKPNTGGRGMGVENMEERVYALGGQFNVSFQEGFRIFVSIPKIEN